MSFLAALEERGRALAERMGEIRHIVATAEPPDPHDPAAVTNGVRLPFDVRDRLLEAQSRHGFRSTRECIYRAIVLGLVTLERLEPVPTGKPVRQPRRRTFAYRALSETEISQLRDRGWDATASAGS